MDPVSERCLIHSQVLTTLSTDGIRYRVTSELELSGLSKSHGRCSTSFYPCRAGGRLNKHTPLRIITNDTYRSDLGLLYPSHSSCTHIHTGSRLERSHRPAWWNNHNCRCHQPALVIVTLSIERALVRQRSQDLEASTIHVIANTHHHTTSTTSTPPHPQR